MDRTRALAHFAHFPPFHVTRHLAWTNSDFGNFETRFDDCDHCPDDWKRQTELARSHLEALLEDCDGSRESSSGRDGGGDITCGNVGINAEVLSSSS